MPQLRHTPAMLVSCLSAHRTNSRRCCMGEVSFQGTDPSSGPHCRCHPCARSSLSPMSSVCTGPGRGALGRKTAVFRLKEKTRERQCAVFRLKEKTLPSVGQRSFDLKKKLVMETSGQW